MIKILELSTREPLSPARLQWQIQDRVIQFWLIVDEFIHNIRRGQPGLSTWNWPQNHFDRQFGFQPAQEEGTGRHLLWIHCEYQFLNERGKGRGLAKEYLYFLGWRLQMMKINDRSSANAYWCQNWRTLVRGFHWVPQWASPGSTAPSWRLPPSPQPQFAVVRTFPREGSHFCVL